MMTITRNQKEKMLSAMKTPMNEDDEICIMEECAEWGYCESIWNGQMGCPYDDRRHDAPKTKEAKCQSQPTT